jgi:uracil-DNA glycosylase
MNRWELHIKEWKDCRRCSLSEIRQNTVLLAGDVPCQVLFVGEAPGHSEDAIGEPFIGDAGHILRYEIISEAIPDNVTYAITNLIACIPLGDDGVKTEEPPEDCIRSCAPRLIDLVEFCKPKLIVCVGKHAEHYLDTKYLHRIKIPDSIPRISIVHPAFILRKQDSRELLVKKCIIAIREGIKTHIRS